MRLSCGREGHFMAGMIFDENARAAGLIAAQEKAEQLFEAIAEKGLVVAGRSETEVSDDIRDLAREVLGVRRYWHDRIVRTGENTLLPYDQSPPVRVIEPDDIVFCDFGPIFQEWEADFGRTFVLGDDPDKRRLSEDLPRIWNLSRQFFEAMPNVTGTQLYAHVKGLARQAGWELGSGFTGHLVGQFPHDMVPPPNDVDSYIAPGSDLPMRRKDATGRDCHWILEIHLVDRQKRFGGFCEELLDLGHVIPRRVPAAAGGTS